MSTFKHGSISKIETTAPNLHAFRITGHVDDDDLEAMAEYMNKVFDTTEDKVDMLIDMGGMTGRDMDAMFDGDVMKAHMRSWSKVRRYAVIAAPDRAGKMIEWSDKVIPVEARAFDASEADNAWAFVGARPTSDATTSTPA
ncbi:STAS/SEC14 domain-containing protein [Marivita sp. S0852]|uniref:STAS/SEC14 domain-containing protein n=1 Tax=Marivita sp. S0852 TaxID=3373893 RepID=UPI003981997C